MIVAPLDRRRCYTARDLCLAIGASYDNALAGSIIGLYKTEVIRQRGPWRNLEAVGFATLE